MPSYLGTAFAVDEDGPATYLLLNNVPSSDIVPVKLTPLWVNCALVSQAELPLPLCWTYKYPPLSYKDQSLRLSVNVPRWKIKRGLLPLAAYNAKSPVRLPPDFCR